LSGTAKLRPSSQKRDEGFFHGCAKEVGVVIMGLDPDELAGLNLNAPFQNRWLPGKKAAPNENDWPARSKLRT